MGIIDFFAELPAWAQILIVLLWIIFPNIGNVSILRWRQKRTHETCPLYPDHIRSLKEAQERATAPYILIRDQMTQTEDIQSDIRSILLRHYMKLLKEHRNSIDGLTADPEYRDYMNTLAYVLKLVKKKVLTFYRENHLAEMSEIEFREKTRVRIDQILNIFSMEMDAIYSTRMDISREKLYEHNQEVLPEIRDRLEEMFAKAKILAIAAKDKLEAIEQKED